MSKSEVRDELVLNLERKLVGPEAGPDELIKTFPSNKYIVGVLYPSGTEVEPEQAVDILEEEDESEGEVVSSKSSRNPRNPSSFGMSFMVDEGTIEIPVEISWATYNKTDEEDFKRKEWNVEKTISLSETGMEDGLYYPLFDSADPEYKNFEIYCRKYVKAAGHHYVSIFMVNKEKNAEKKGGMLDQRCIFSPSICVHFDDRSIVAKENESDHKNDDDLMSLSLLYHNRHEFGTGHGCSVEWNDVLNNNCSTLKTTFLPRYHWHPLYFKDKEYSFFMKDMADSEKKKETIEILSNLLKDYENWISETFAEDKKETIERAMHDTFDKHHIDCQISLERMRNGLACLGEKDVFSAFSFMNEAMFLQRVYSQAAREYRENEEKGFLEPDIHGMDTIERHKWRAFQIAFILQSIPGIVDPNNKDREVADLLWIPTGGGKTEAYLGLSAFTMGLRRLKAKDKAITEYLGVNVIMRYTLRLLTIQQFQRATSLICACEIIRKRNRRMWGTEIFSIGLFVGQSTTSNQIGDKKDYDLYQKDHLKYHFKNTTAHYALEFWNREDSKPDTSNPFQLSYCPWCGEELDKSCFRIDADSDYLLTNCKRKGCPFNKMEIPAFTVDDNIYSRLPSMIIGTVDKFAMLPFKPKIGMLFGHVEKYCPSHGFLFKTDNHPQSHQNGVQTQKINRPLNPPDLIIQDELHLINGPLGSMVGLYETTIDRLSCRQNEQVLLKPKLIASTATIRKAEEQVKNLFSRELKRFPSSGTDYSDSFFVKEIEDNSLAKMFVGVFPSGIGQKTVMKRTMSSFLMDVQQMKLDGSPVDYWDEYWTIVSYFNSIRDLGSAKTTIEDDVFNDIKISKRDILPVKELTSRISSKELPEILDQLNLKGDKDESISVITCSNMFSVGVDVQRLGLMIMNNQPKSTSEYIQSVGRVGRNKTGLVIVLYNWGRPRDQSHYERFYDYHNRIQSHVEAMTVTPFSEGARERALHAQYVSMVRVLSKNLSKESDAINFDKKFRSSAESRDFSQWISDRIASISPDEKHEAETCLNNFLDYWITQSKECNDIDDPLKYQKLSMSSSDEPFILRKIDDKVSSEAGFLPILTPTSMRNVEKEVEITKIYGIPGKI